MIINAEQLDQLLVKVLGVVMKKPQILTETWSGILECNIVPRKTRQVLEYLPKQNKKWEHTVYSIWDCVGIGGPPCAIFWGRLWEKRLGKKLGRPKGWKVPFVMKAVMLAY